MLTTEQRLVQIAGFTCGCISIIATVIYLIYIVVQSCRKEKAEWPILNRTIRLQIGLQLSVVYGVISVGLYMYFDATEESPTNPSAICMIQAIMLHSANWLVLMYNLMLCIWLVIPVFSGQKMRMWSKTKQMLFELGSHAIVFSVCCFHNLLIEKVAGLFVGLTFIGNSYGKSGLWCWVTNVTELGKIFQMAFFIGPLWAVIFAVVIMYVIMFIHVYRTFNAVRQDMKLVKIGKEIFKKGEVSLEVQNVYNEWRVCARLAVWPIMYILLWIAPSVNRIQNVITGTWITPLSYFHLISYNLHGLCNVILFFVNPLQHAEIFRKLLCCEYCCPPKDENEAQEMQDKDMNYAKLKNTAEPSE